MARKPKRPLPVRSARDVSHIRGAGRIAIWLTVVYMAARTAFILMEIEGGQSLWNLVNDRRVLEILLRAGVLALILPIFRRLSRSPRLTRRRGSVLPLLLVIATSVPAYVLDGDPHYFYILTGLTVVSMFYLDPRGYLIFALSADAIALFCVTTYPGQGAEISLLGLRVTQNMALRQLLVYGGLNLILLFIGRAFSRDARASDRLATRFITMLETTPNFLCITDKQGRVEYISQCLAEWCGIGKWEYAQGMPMLDLFPTPDMKMVFQEFMQQDGYVERDFDVVINDKRGWFSLRSAPMVKNSVARFYEWNDITPIMEAKNLAEASARAKSDFLAKMSHEIRTPMNAIMGMSELILRESLPPSVRENAGSIQTASTNLLSIINDILDFSKIESGKTEIVEAEYEFSSMINDTISIVRMRLTDKPIQFAAFVDAAIPAYLWGDEARVRQVLLNLLTNACKYTKEGHISLDISCKRDGNTATLTAAITDTGIGIAEEDMDKLFQDFAQVDLVKNKNIEGTGLGLVITRSLCRAMGGDIKVESTYGVGSTFTVTVPQHFNNYTPLAEVENAGDISVLLYETRRVYADSMEKQMQNLGVRCKQVYTASQLYEELQNGSYKYVFASSFAFEKVHSLIDDLGLTDVKIVLLTAFGETVATGKAQAMAMPATSVSLSHLLNGVTGSTGYAEGRGPGARFIAPSARILIVDDINTNLRVAEGLMLPYQMKIDTCKSGKEAINLVTDNDYDIVFMDHMMPEMDGIEATEHIRALPGRGYDALPIVALTANAISGMKDMFIQNGLNDFLAKPIETGKLALILEKWVPKEKQEKFVESQETHKEAHFQIPGVDTRTGMAMTGGSVEGYIKTLMIFRQDGIERIPQIQGALQQNDIALFTTYVHALKSASASIGASAVSELARELETAGHHEDVMFIDRHAGEFLVKLQDLLDAIKPVTAVLDSRTPTAESDLGPLREALPKLREALYAVDVGTVDVLMRELGTHNWSSSISSKLEQVAQSILIFEIDEALETISALEDEVRG